MFCWENVQQKYLEMGLIFQLGTSRPHWLTSDFVFLQAMQWAARALQSFNFFLFQSLYKPCTGSNVYL